MAVKEGFVEVTGGKVWYRMHEGKQENTPVIILHGGPGSSHYSMQGLDVLAEERPVIFYDQLGCGNSDRPDDESLWKLDRFTDELAKVREALNLKKVHILGHSWGTTLAAAYLLSGVTGVQSVIFSSPCLSAPKWAEDQEHNRKLLPEDVQKILRECEISGRTDSEEYKEATKEFNRHFVCRLDPLPEILIEGAPYRGTNVYQTMWGPSEFYVTGNLKEFDCTRELRNISVPSLYTCGRYDEATPESTGYYSSLTPVSFVHVFEHSAHMPYLEETEEYIKVIGSFLRKND
ncbi:proline iminopeptidase-family hydrolase [Evansella clarkii]|uniref:proline iminopeptidase-family hydrolase n=1 Tax=Evansella clarkii TaxID=79879 RepID=UPI000997D0D3|nr:proline iminopeptidase-family hydrolase [Evansella clarkii]